ncbi:hypothetical protein COU58_02845 [Candidatus Pacearchaeota archaeon CG10_big_fil_rev_8_21_14_0_10_32_42]|nr:MAG: hypothetical protein COU58_02845 [Candidatus Pacearchaeota archaeon CG10_big_fil_rev_8_21_14_0_10_32_42]
MLIELLLFLILGVLAGTLTGLTPGIHINLVSGLLLTLSLYSLSPIYLVTFIVSMAITHTFLDFIPSVFLGCPDTDTELSVLPGHELLKNKKGFEAIYLSNIGSLIAIVLLLILLFPSMFLLEKYGFIMNSLIPYILIGVSGFIIMTEKKKGSALLVFLLTGILGFSTSSIELTQPLLPLLTGLFGASSIIISIKNKTEIPEQEITKSKISLKKPILGALFSAPFCGFLPGMGSGQAAVIGSTIARTDEKQFLVLLGIVNTLVMGFSFITLYSLERMRSGAAIAINQLIGKFEINYLILIFVIIIFTGLIAFVLTNFLAKYFSLNFKKINYKILSYTTLSILIAVVFLVSGVLGLLILIISTLTGIYSIKLKVKRTNMMGCLIIPTILFYFGIL